MKETIEQLPFPAQIIFVSMIVYVIVVWVIVPLVNKTDKNKESRKEKKEDGSIQKSTNTAIAGVKLGVKIKTDINGRMDADELADLVSRYYTVSAELENREKREKIENEIKDQVVFENINFDQYIDVLNLKQK